MFYLMLAIVSATANGLVIRFSEKYVKNSYSMLAGNYAVCLILALLYLYPAQLFPADAGLARTMGFGAINGMLYLAGFVMIQRNTRVHGVVLTSIFSRLGVLVPTVLSVAVFGEVPTGLQVVGFVLAIAAILLMNLEKGKGLGGVQIALVIMMLLNGSCDGMAKVYDQMGSAALAEHFLVYTFFAALLYNVALVLWRKERPSWVDLGFGVLLGVPNYFVARFLLKAVSQVPAVIVYPSFSVGSIILITIAGVAFFHEKLTKRQMASMAIILAALVLLNI